MPGGKQVQLVAEGFLSQLSTDTWNIPSGRVFVSEGSAALLQ